MRFRRDRAARWGIPAAVLVAVPVLVIALTALFVLVRARDGRQGDEAATPPSTMSSTTAGTATGSPASRLPPPSQPTRASTTTPATPPITTPATTAEFPVPASLRGRDVTVLPTTRRVVALTFDAGGDAAGLSSILRTLAAEHVRATFFLTGRWASANPAGTAAVLAGGHRVGNHSVTHPHFPALSDAQVRAELLGAQTTIRASGADPRPLFRFPFGDRDARTIADVNALGYVAVSWTVDTLGWEGTAGGMSAQRVADRALSALRPGEIVLMHVGANPDDGTTFDADALPGTISRMRAAGYDFVTLDALLG